MRLHVAVEEDGKRRLNELGSWTYVPLEETYGHRLTWRTRFAFGFDDAYEAAPFLVQLRAGLVIYGTSCFVNGRASHRGADDCRRALLFSPWYIATDVWMAIRLGCRPAFPAECPLVAGQLPVKPGGRSRRKYLQ